MNVRKDIIAALPDIFAEVKEVNTKWHINTDGTYKKRDEHFNTRCILLMKSELMEAFEGIRKGNQPDDHLPQYPSESVELTDLFIRSIDYIVFSDSTVAKKALFTDLHNEDTNTLILFEDVMTFYAMLDLMLVNAYEDPDVWLCAVIDTIIAYCENQKIPLMEIYRAKMDYNKTRKDHSAEARASVGGKKF